MCVSLASIGRFSSFGCWLAILASFPPQRSAAETTDATRESAFSAAWRLVENLPDNRYQAELTLHNASSKALAPPWAIYFNSSSRIDPKTVAAPLVLSHVNGDFYVLKADKTGSPIGAGKSLVVEYFGNPWAINVSDAPSGMYLVQTDAAGNERTPVKVSLEIRPFPDAAKVRRGAGDQVPVVTAESRFADNAKLTKLPLDTLPPVVPTPVAVEQRTGEVEIDSATTIVYEPALENEARFLADSLYRTFKLQLELAPAPGEGTNSIRLKLSDVKIGDATKRHGGEAYRLSATSADGIEIVGTDPAGVFYGLQTLRGLVPLAAYRMPGKPLSIAAVEIVDAPRFHYRGLHLDVARNFQNVETVKKLLDLMAFYKLNRLHWHLTDDEGWRVEIKALPELTSVGGRRGHTLHETDFLIPSLGSGPDSKKSPGSGHYTQDEFIDVLRYAQARHITVIPELDVPGHSRAAVKAMAARALRVGDKAEDFRLTDPGDESHYESVQAWRDNVIDVGREQTYTFLDVVIGELAEMYRRASVPFECVHLGGDEVPKGAWEASPACRSIPTQDGTLSRGQQLELHFLKRSCGLVAKHGAAPACWDDCLLFAKGDSEWPARPTAYVWNNVWGWGREDAAYRLANAGFDVVLCNATHLYFDLAHEKDPLEPGYYWAGFVDTRAPFEFNPLDVFQNARSNSMGQPLAAGQFADSVRLSPAGREHIRGIQGELWGENLRSPAALEYMAFPRTIALAERAWAAEPDFAKLSDPVARNAALDRAWNQFANALGQRELPRLSDLAGEIRYRIPPPGAVVRDGKLHANVDFPGLMIRYTTDGKLPTTDSPLYDHPLPTRPGYQLRAFDAHGHASRSVEIDQSELE